MAEAARRQYNKLKMQTKAEIRQTIDRLLVGDFIVSFFPQNVYVDFYTFGLGLGVLKSEVCCCLCDVLCEQVLSVSQGWRCRACFHLLKMFFYSLQWESVI